MSLVLPAFVAHCWSNHQVDQLYAWIHPDNAASERVAERAGFSRAAALDATGRTVEPPASGFALWVLDRTR
jgi:RimJ/RimL family protein N-acetyltransferase